MILRNILKYILRSNSKTTEWNVTKVEPKEYVNTVFIHDFIAPSTFRKARKRVCVCLRAVFEYWDSSQCAFLYVFGFEHPWGNSFPRFIIPCFPQFASQPPIPPPHLHLPRAQGYLLFTGIFSRMLLSFSSFYVPCVLLALVLFPFGWFCSPAACWWFVCQCVVAI